MRIRLTLDIQRRRPEPDYGPEPPAVYDTAPAHLERDPSLDMGDDPETRTRPRIGFHG